MISCPFEAGTFDEKSNILICRPTGELTADIALDLMTCRDCLEREGLPQVNRFHDLTGITSINLSFREVFEICRVEADFRSPEEPVKACYLVANEVVFGTIKMYAAVAETRGVSVSVGYHLDELAEVLGVDPSRLAP